MALKSPKPSPRVGQVWETDRSVYNEKNEQWKITAIGNTTCTLERVRDGFTDHRYPVSAFHAMDWWLPPKDEVIPAFQKGDRVRYDPASGHGRGRTAVVHTTPTWMKLGNRTDWYLSVKWDDMGTDNLGGAWADNFTLIHSKEKKIEESPTQEYQEVIEI